MKSLHVNTIINSTELDSNEITNKLRGVEELGARFTNTDPLLTLKNNCQDLLKTCSEKLALKSVDTVIFMAAFIAYAFVGVSFQKRKKKIWEESI